MPWRVLPVLALGLVFTWNWAVDAADVLRAELAIEQLASTRDIYRQHECMGNAMLIQLPKTRSRIRIETADGHWSQRLTEMGYPRHDIVEDVAAADYLVTLAPEPGECGAPKVVVSPTR